MLIFFGILVIIFSIVLGLIVLVQNPKGGGLSGTFGGVGNQLMGVKQTTDVLEKGTWVFAALVGILCILSPVFIPKANGKSSKTDQLIEQAGSSAPKNTQQTAPLPTAAPKDTTPKP